jgi:hypothetical protein
VYAYNHSTIFPSQTANGSNYWVDMVFDPQPAVTNVTPAANAVGVIASTAVTVTFITAMDPTTISTSTIFLKDSSGNVVPASVSYNAATLTATLTPSSALSPTTTYTAFVLGGNATPVVKDTGGNTLRATFSWSFTVDGPAPTVNSVTPANGATGVSTTSTVSVAFSHAMGPTTITTSTLFLTGPSGNVVPATVTYNASTFTATLTPDVNLATSATYTATVLGGSAGAVVKDANGKPLASSATWSFTTSPQPALAPSLWAPTTTPAVASVNDPNSVELGVKFYADSGGYVTGIRFYKGSQNTGTHVGNLWTTGGQLLASATFSGETPSGWQQVNFAGPVLITAGTTYVASYFTSFGFYSKDDGYFNNAGVDDYPLHAPATGAVAGGNGVYAYGASSTFPDNTINGSNYWVDVVFNALPAVASTTPAAGATLVNTATAVTAVFNKAMGPTTINASTVFLQDGSGNVVPASVSYNASTLTATLTPTSALAAATTYTLTVLGGSGTAVKDTAGNAMPVTYTSSFFTDGPAAVVTAVSPAAGTTGVSTAATVSVTFSHAMGPTTLTSSTFFLTGPSGNVPASVSYNSGTNTATLTPYGFLATSATYTATVAGGSSGAVVKDLNGRPLAASSTWSFGTAAVASFFPSLWRPTVTPAVASMNDPSSIEVGAKFTSDVAGTITGIRFYKGSLNTGTHLGHLWTASGQILASVMFSNETASGWQQANFASPVAIAANTVYVASYFTSSGFYSKDDGYFNNAGVDDYPLHAPATGAVAGGNGVYAYSPIATFPNNTVNGSNYWVDVVFSTSPAVTSVTPAAGATNVSRSSAITITFDRAMDPTTLNASTIFLQDSSGNVVPATLSYNASTNTVTLTPSSPLNAVTTYTMTVHGGNSGPRVRDQFGNFLAADYTWSFTTGS